MHHRLTRAALPALAFTLSLTLAAPAFAEEREFCASRPGLDTPACTLAPGSVMVEVGVAGWERTSDGALRTDSLTFADTALRLGVAERTEVQIEFAGITHEIERNRLSGARSTATAAGDLTLGLRRSLSGVGGPVAVQASITLPVGKAPAGDGQWSASVIVPVEFDLAGGWGFSIGPEVDAAVNESGRGRHVAFGSVAALSAPLAPGLSLAGEVALFRDNDPAGHQTQALAGISLAWMAAPNLQLDLEVQKRLAGAVPAHAVMIGFARKLR